MTEDSRFIISNNNISVKNVSVSSDYHHQFYNNMKKKNDELSLHKLRKNVVEFKPSQLSCHVIMFIILNVYVLAVNLKQAQKA